MRHVLLIGAVLLDPRGRIDRKLFLVIIGGALAALVFGEVARAASIPGSLLEMAALVVLCWTLVSALLKRLHDLGEGAEKLLEPIAMAFVLMILATIAGIMLGQNRVGEALRDLERAQIMTVAAPFLALMLRLALLGGEPTPNRFGASPDAWGWGRPHDPPREFRAVV